VGRDDYPKKIAKGNGLTKQMAGSWGRDRNVGPTTLYRNHESAALPSSWMNGLFKKFRTAPKCHSPQACASHKLPLYRPIEPRTIGLLVEF
jgi:hypothetical protein